MQNNERGLKPYNDYFKLFEFSAKWDPIPTMLTQNHTLIVKGFMGQTTSFKKKLIKSDVVVMGENRSNHLMSGGQTVSCILGSSDR